MNNKYKKENIDKFLIDLFKIFHQIEKNGKVALFNPSFDNLLEDSITLGNVEEKLHLGYYNSNYWIFIEHVTKALKCIQNIFTPRTKIHRCSLECEAIYNIKMKEFMKIRKGYCCAKYRVIKSRQVECSGMKNNIKCIVRNNQGYYVKNSLTYCDSCFNKLTDSDSVLNDQQTVNKCDFKYYVYKEEQNEEFIKCISCNRFYHERCVLHFKLSGIPFFCKSCSTVLPEIMSMKISSETIPKTEIDSFIEDYIRNTKIENSERIIIRMLSCSQKKFKPKKCISSYRRDMSNRREILYRNCMLFAFIKHKDNSELCFFGIFLQLYGDENCPASNKNCAYISFIDSVKLNEMKERTNIYQQIIFGIFEYLKLKIFRKVFIWSCPPDKNVDYIFFEKPSIMRRPTKKHLSQWYEILLKLALDNAVIDSYSCIKEYSKQNNWRDLSRIPYFYGDIWTVRLEQAIKEAELRAQKSIMSRDQIIERINDWMEVQIAYSDKDYFVVNLNSTIDVRKSTFPNINRGISIGNRTDLLDISQEFNLTYLTLRSAKYSTFLLLYRFFCEDSICCKCGAYLKNGVDAFLMCTNCNKLLNIKIDKNRSSDKALAVYPRENDRKRKITQIDLTFYEDEMITDSIQNISDCIIDLTKDNILWAQVKPFKNEFIDLCNDD